jgi:hypothetical protein
MGSMSEKLAAAAAALGIPTITAPGPIQVVYNRYKKHLHLRVIDSPLPEKVHLLSENFLYWIKLEYPNPDMPGKWVQAKPSVVIPMLENGTFNETGFRIDEKRANALFNLPNLLARPNCIHGNLRNQEERGLGGIKGDHVYVAYHGLHTRTVAFTRFDPDIKKVIVVSSFSVSKEWVARCAEIPAKYLQPKRSCRCK